MSLGVIAEAIQSPGESGEARRTNPGNKRLAPFAEMGKSV
jgi:hypothetical protein